MRSELLEVSGRDGLILRVEFLWHVDRYRHVISAVEPGVAVTPLLESIEGSLADDWPPSPPLQSLHIESRPDGRRIALLMGMAGNGHWSASIGQRPGGNGLMFDLACRAGSPGKIGTTYRFADGVRLTEMDAIAVRLQRGDQVLSVEASEEAATRSEFAVVDVGAVRVIPLVLGSTVAPTRRWRYDLVVNHQR